MTQNRKVYMKRRKGEFSDNIKFSNACSEVEMAKKFYIKNKIKRNAKISRESWLAESRALADQIRMNHDNQMIDVDWIIEMDKQDLENRFSLWIEE